MEKKINSDNIEETVLNFVLDFFINSQDFNGMPISSLSKLIEKDQKQTIEIIKTLVKEEKLIIQTGNNPHIIALGFFPIDYQIEKLDEAKLNSTRTIMKIQGGPKFVSETHLICLYPTEPVLKKQRQIHEFADRPFTKQLALGETQLKPVYFDIDVLDRYFRDPRFSFDFEDYSGKISYHQTEEKASELRKEDQFFMQTFGIGTDEHENRVAVVYLRYLSNLTPEHQVFWKSKIRKDKCRTLQEYYDNTIVGIWTTSYSVFKAFIGEQKLLNEMSIAIFERPLFNKTFEDEKRPKEFTFFMTPTLENYNLFILLLDKMYSENINKDFFRGVIETQEFLPISEGIVERREKGTIKLLQEFLEKLYQPKERKVLDDIFVPIKEIRRERQNPAHRINENFYDRVFEKKQKEMMKKAYLSISALRYIFQSHPIGREVEIPSWLVNGSIKIF